MKLEDMIYEILIKKDISQQDFASELRVDPAQVSRWLSGDNKPRRKTYQKIKKIYEEMTCQKVKS